MKNTGQLPSEIYEQIVQNTPANLPERVLEIIQPHDTKENRLSRRMLVNEVFNVTLPYDVNLASLSIDRMVRRAIKKLSITHPIIGSSGSGGYWYCKDKEELQKIRRENNAKAMKLLMANVWLTIHIQNYDEQQFKLPLTVENEYTRIVAEIGTL